VSIQLSEQVKALERSMTEFFERQARELAAFREQALARELELIERLERLEQRSKPAPKPKDGNV
jgi:hypothetical protein